MLKMQTSTRHILSAIEEKRNLICSGLMFSQTVLFLNSALPQRSRLLDVAATCSLMASNALILWNHWQAPESDANKSTEPSRYIVAAI